MTADKIRRTLFRLDDIINGERSRKFPIAKQDTTVPGISKSHLRWMVKEALVMVEHVSDPTSELDETAVRELREKAMRWLGFIQGVLVDRGEVSIDELRELNS